MATYLRKLKRGDMRNKCPNIRVREGPIYTGAKIRVYAVKCTYMRVSQITLYMLRTRSAFWLHGCSLVNKPLQAAGMSADNVRGWEIVRKMNIWPRSEASRANVKFWGQSLSQGHYQPTYQQARKGFIYFITLPLIFSSQKTARKLGKKAIGDLIANARDWHEGAT